MGPTATVLAVAGGALALLAVVIAVNQWGAISVRTVIAYSQLLWESLLPNRRRKLLASAAYAAAFMCGLSTLLWPPRSIEGVLGSILTTGFGLFYLVGGAVALLTVFRGWWWAERGGIVAIMFGVGIYVLIVLTLHMQSAMGSRLSQYWAIVAVLPLLAYRFDDIRKYPYEPRPETVRRDE